MRVSESSVDEDEGVGKIRKRANEAWLRAELAWNCGAVDTAKHARLSAALHWVRAEELEQERFVPVHAGE